MQEKGDFTTELSKIRVFSNSSLQRKEISWSNSQKEQFEPFQHAGKDEFPELLPSGYPKLQENRRADLNLGEEKHGFGAADPHWEPKPAEI